MLLKAPAAQHTCVPRRLRSSKPPAPVAIDALHHALHACRTPSPSLAGLQIFFKGAFRTNGGHMFDVSVTYDDKETEHRIIVGRDYYEFQGLSPEEVVERVLAFLTRKKIPRHTEGASRGCGAASAGKHVMWSPCECWPCSPVRRLPGMLKVCLEPVQPPLL